MSAQVPDEHNPYGVKVGQVWEDNDKRSPGRRVTVVSVGRDVRRQHWIATVSRNGRHTQIRLDRFKPTSTGYTLVRETTP